MRPDHSGWRTRGYLPHYDAAGEIQHIVFRLADSLPAAVLARVDVAPGPDRAEAAEAALDAGLGSRALANPAVAEIIRDGLLYFDSTRYRLLAWCVMPAHVHVLVQQAPGWRLEAVVQGWKSVSARRANLLLGRTGPFWAREYFDRAMRSEQQTETTAAYIIANPVKAGLCKTPEAWPWSSATPG
ncbi:MAG TPA: transposase [Caulobacteraceae bacterium]|jgi:putative DNA methylase|nr:transposase [Caulobacteraceae bacterium]